MITSLTLIASLHGSVIPNKLSMKTYYFLGSKTAQNVVVIGDNLVFQEVKVQRIEIKENCAYGTVLFTAQSTQLANHGGKCVREETAKDYY